MGGVGGVVVLGREPCEVTPEVAQVVECLPWVVAPIARREAEPGCHLAQHLAAEAALHPEQRYLGRPATCPMERLHPPLAAAPGLKRLVVDRRRDRGAC